MNFHLQPGVKFACVAFEDVAIDHSLSKPLSLGEGLWTLPEHPFDLNHRWRESIGKISADQIDRCNFFLLVVKASTRPEILDDENENLRKQLNRLVYGLLLQGIPKHGDGFVLTGARVSEETRIREFSKMQDYFDSNPPDRVKFSESTCRMAKSYAEGFRDIENSIDYKRVRRGMDTLICGIREESLQERIHNYVRSLEALVMPKIGKSQNQFIHRCQTFALASPQARNIIEDCYRIRSAVEHMNPFEDALSKYPSDGQQLVAFQRLRQIEQLAFSVYMKLTTSKSHALLFETDTSIDAFWSRKDDERRAEWSSPIDITVIV